MDFISLHRFPPVFSYIMLHIYAKADISNGIYIGANNKYGFAFGGGAEAGFARGEITQGVTVAGAKFGITRGKCIECVGVTYRMGYWYDNKRGELNMQGFGSAAIEGGVKLGGSISIPINKWIKVIGTIKKETN